ncbi:MAG: hypothetical protein P4L10_12255 [Acidobacteriaceae bacterium]|nr:hypothetical protein [Acidobacteriaceae bacterium]
MKNMTRFVDGARAEGIKPILMTSETFRRWDKQGHLKTVDDVEVYEAIIRTVGRQKKVPLLGVDAITREFYL